MKFRKNIDGLGRQVHIQYILSLMAGAGVAKAAATGAQASPSSRSIGPKFSIVGPGPSPFIMHSERKLVPHFAYLTTLLSSINFNLLRRVA